MRITQTMLSNNMLRNLMNSQVKMDKYLEQLYTQKKISRPSDDPVIAMKGMKYRTEVIEIEQYKRNTIEVNNWMDNSDAALDKATEAMQRLRELAVQASNLGTNSEDEHASIMAEAEQLKKHMIDIANTNVNGKYIFNGTNTGKKPVEIDDDGTLSTNQSNDPVMIEVSKGTTIRANVSPDGVFDEGLFTAIDDFIERLENNPDQLGTSIEELDDKISNIINARADLGARMNRLELIENRLEEQEGVAKKTMVTNENIDFEEAITNLITQETLHRAALSAGSRIIQPTLIDFLR